jgi:hypothetical protein
MEKKVKDSGKKRQELKDQKESCLTVLFVLSRGISYKNVPVLQNNTSAQQTRNDLKNSEPERTGTFQFMDYVLLFLFSQISSLVFSITFSS